MPVPNPITDFMASSDGKLMASLLREQIMEISILRRIMPPKPLVPSVMDMIRDMLRAENVAHGKA